MFQSVAKLDLEDFTQLAPAFLIIAGIPLCFSIAEGIGLGLIAYAVLHLCTGRAREVPIIGYVLALIFALHLMHSMLVRIF